MEREIEKLMSQFAAMSRQQENYSRDMLHNLIELRKDIAGLKREMVSFFDLYKEMKKWSEYNEQSEVSTQSQSPRK